MYCKDIDDLVVKSVCMFFLVQYIDYIFINALYILIFMLWLKFHKRFFTLGTACVQLVLPPNLPYMTVLFIYKYIM